MGKAELILELTKKKDKKVTMQFNKKLWEMFAQACEEEGKKPTQKIEEFILKYLEDRGKL